MKTVISNLPKIIITILALALVAVVGAALIDNLFLFKFEMQFENGEKMKGTDCRDTISTCGKLGEADDFTFIAAALIEVKEDGDADEKSIKRFYETTAGLEGAVDASHTVTVEVVKLKNSSYSFSPSLFPDRTYIFDDTTTVRNPKNCYAVIIYDMGNSSPLDYRTYIA